MKSLNNPTPKLKLIIFLLDSIEIEENENATDKEKINYFFDCYDREFNHDYNKRYYPNEQERLKNYLQGLPSFINIPYYDWDILELYKELNGIKTLSSKKEESVLKYYWDKIAFTLIQLKRKYN
jgi:hypothetical protein